MTGSEKNISLIILSGYIHRHDLECHADAPGVALAVPSPGPPDITGELRLRQHLPSPLHLYLQDLCLYLYSYC